MVVVNVNSLLYMLVSMKNMFNLVFILIQSVNDGYMWIIYVYDDFYMLLLTKFCDERLLMWTEWQEMDFMVEMVDQGHGNEAKSVRNMP